MNIFVTDPNPRISAEALCDRHLVKMVLETAQLLCSQFPEHMEPPYRRTHYNHPCSKWCRQSEFNYLWLLEHGKALAQEYTARYGKEHKSEAVILWCETNWAELRLPKEPMTPFARAMPDIFKAHEYAYDSYRAYYLFKLREWSQAGLPMTWLDYPPPVWVTDDPTLVVEEKLRRSKLFSDKKVVQYIVRRSADG